MMNMINKVLKNLLWNSKVAPFPFNNRGEVNAPEKTTIKVDGQEIEVTQEELVNYAQQGKHYAQSMEGLKKDKDSLAEEKVRVDALSSVFNEMEADPKLKAAMTKAYNDTKAGKVINPVVKDANLKEIDKLIEETADPAGREQLRLIRKIVQQEAPGNNASEKTAELEKMILELQTKLATVESTALLGHASTIEVQVKKLEEEFGIDLVAKHKREIVSHAIKYPNQKVSKLLYHFADDSEIKAALLKQAEINKQREIDRKKDGSGPGGPSSTFIPTTEVRKDDRGRKNFGDVMKRIKERLGKK